MEPRLKMQRLSIVVRIGFGVFAGFSAFGAWAIGTHITSSDDWIFVLVAVGFAVAFSFGAIAGRFPDIPSPNEADDRSANG